MALLNSSVGNKSSSFPHDSELARHESDRA